MCIRDRFSRKPPSPRRRRAAVVDRPPSLARRRSCLVVVRAVDLLLCCQYPLFLPHHTRRSNSVRPGERLWIVYYINDHSSSGISRAAIDVGSIDVSWQNLKIIVVVQRTYQPDACVEISCTLFFPAHSSACHFHPVYPRFLAVA